MNRIEPHEKPSRSTVRSAAKARAHVRYRTDMKSLARLVFGRIAVLRRWRDERPALSADRDVSEIRGYAKSAIETHSPVHEPMNSVARADRVRIREYAALGVCASSAAVGFYLLTLGFPFGFVAISIGIIWMCAGSWVSGLWRWAKTRTLREIYMDTLKGKLPRLSPVARILSIGSMVFALMGLTWAAEHFNA
jgi:hypothetical protein